jgi:hypothetical protein
VCGGARAVCAYLAGDEVLGEVTVPEEALVGLYEKTHTRKPKKQNKQNENKQNKKQD